MFLKIETAYNSYKFQDLCPFEFLYYIVTWFVWLTWMLVEDLFLVDVYSVEIAVPKEKKQISARTKQLLHHWVHAHIPNCLQKERKQHQ